MEKPHPVSLEKKVGLKALLILQLPYSAYAPT